MAWLKVIVVFGEREVGYVQTAYTTDELRQREDVRWVRPGSALR